MDEVEYCIYCHQRDKDSCSKGLHEKDGSTKQNPLGITLHGCPLDEKISRDAPAEASWRRAGGTCSS